MSWYHYGDWINSSGKLYRKTDQVEDEGLINRDNPSKKFSSDTTYFHKARIVNIANMGDYEMTMIPSGNNVDFPSEFRNPNLSDFSHTDTSGYLCFYHYNESEYTSNDMITFTASTAFSGGKGIDYYKVSEIDWNIYGFSYLNNTGNVVIGGTLTQSSWGKGWSFCKTEDIEPKPIYVWYDHSYNSYFEPVGPSFFELEDEEIINYVSGDIYRQNNFISKFIKTSFFNLSFDYSQSGDIEYGLKIYMSQDNPYDFYYGTGTQSTFNTDLIANSTLVGEISQQETESVNIYGLKGNQYLYIVADKAETGESAIIVSNLKIEGSYSDSNNILIDTYDNFYTNLPNVSYTSQVGVGNTLIDDNINITILKSKIGNSFFKAGIWENGVWNNGYRVDNSVFTFDNIISSIRIKSDVKWSVTIEGDMDSVNQFKVGDSITVSNIVSIDLNEQRKFLTNSYKITSIGEISTEPSKGFVTFNVDTPYPIRRIERDSSKHRIYITKNIWLSGAFLNGKFEKGIWSSGLFRGYPKITEMVDAHWIDGSFEGGHFLSNKIEKINFTATEYNNGLLTLDFSSTAHNLINGDEIYIDKENKDINPEYDGYATVVEVINENKVTVDKDFGIKTLNESGEVILELFTGLIQNFNFDSKNVSKTTSQENLFSPKIYSYNSWIDVNFFTYSASNIGKIQNKIDDISEKTYSENNHYGFITHEVLSSNSKFRDSHSQRVSSYNLGTKYKIYYDLIGESSEFNEFFRPNSREFLDLGWTFSGSGTFSRTIDEYNSEELKVEYDEQGTAILNIGKPSIRIANRYSGEIEKRRYSMISFDLIDYDISSPYYQSLYSKIPIIHFNNINVNLNNYNFNPYYTNLPIYEPVEHIATPRETKVEYFYNKTNLNMHFISPNQGSSTFVIDNLKMYEVDMIPFFQYFTEDNINTTVQIPLQGIAPYIDYTSADFVFLDNVVFGLDSFDLVTSNEVYSGVGIGISTNPISTVPGSFTFEGG